MATELLALAAGEDSPGKVLPGFLERKSIKSYGYKNLNKREAKNDTEIVALLTDRF